MNSVIFSLRYFGGIFYCSNEKFEYETTMCAYQYKKNQGTMNKVKLSQENCKIKYEKLYLCVVLLIEFYEI